MGSCVGRHHVRHHSPAALHLAPPSGHFRGGVLPWRNPLPELLVPKLHAGTRDRYIAARDTRRSDPRRPDFGADHGVHERCFGARWVALAFSAGSGTDYLHRDCMLSSAMRQAGTGSMAY
ncbi:hypothetical protein D3C77_564940 [compost metagenome]